MQIGLDKGEPTGYTQTLGNGKFIVGEDIEPGLYNVSGLGWADLISMSNPFHMLNQNEDGTIENVELVEGKKLRF